MAGQVDVYEKVELDEALSAARRYLLTQANAAGFWEGRLSSSALANAVAVFALAQVDRAAHGEPIRRGLRWLADTVNADGGWGDTPGSPSNLSATILCWSALSVAGTEAEPALRRVERSAEAWLRRAAGGLGPSDFVRSLKARYGTDNTFSVPILAMCALAGRLGGDGWRFVPGLPFELALLPHRVYRWIRFSVVSYGIPALLAIGGLTHRHRPARCPLTRAVRDRLFPRALRLVADMQPSHGGFQDSAVLTGFVTLGLAGAGCRDHPIVKRGVQFLLSHCREDGSWPIDTNVATWLSALAVRAFDAGGPAMALPAAQRRALSAWFLAQQHTAEHPMTHAPPGGWGWTDQPGSIPDGDDTAGVLAALPKLGDMDDRTRAAGMRALNWLIGLQNADGGMPTFCRGWGKLPFDRSCPDITAHALLAIDQWMPLASGPLRKRLERAGARCVCYLQRKQASDGSWLPLWFGNQLAAGERSPVYGTARALLSLRELTLARTAPIAAMIERGGAFLVRAQNPDGGWGGALGVPSSTEETALAVSALAGADHAESVRRGTNWLLQATGLAAGADGGLRFEAAPIGLYFDRLWYAQELYPAIFTFEALARVRRLEDGKTG
ncbi:MAG: squalene--hopene cyclase [Kiritimatiellae bacterium]|nr:squalene--hopene cyclase [Kiritimatiellia bacterium]